MISRSLSLNKFMVSDLSSADELAQLRAEVAQLRAQNVALRAQNQTLCLSDLRLCRLLDSEIIGVLLGSANGDILQANSSFERMIGRSSAQLKLAEWQNYVPPAELSRHREKSELLWTTGSCAAWETEFMRPDGSRVPVITGATVVDSAQFQAGDGAQFYQAPEEDTRTLLLWALDISERKNIENELRASENQMRAIVENLHDGLLITDLDDTIIYANGRISELSGYRNDELIGRNAYRLLGPPETWADCQNRNLERAQGKSGTYEAAICHKDGSTRWMLINGSPLRDASGVIVGTIGAHFDITERKRDEVERAQFAARLENSNRDLEIFAFAVSHDLKAPLRKIEVFGGYLEQSEGSNLSSGGRLYLNRMRDASRRMSALIDGLLAYSRVATGEQPRREVDLNRVAREVLLDLEVAIERAGAMVEIGELPMVRADATQMRQLLQNLVGNAIAYRRPDVAAVVRVSGRVSDGHCEIEVADNGRGFTDAQATAIFEIFRRLENQSNAGESSAGESNVGESGASESGAGVGLAICRAIVERHGGTLTAQGTPGQGAIFRARFPVDSLISGRDVCEN